MATYFKKNINKFDEIFQLLCCVPGIGQKISLLLCRKSGILPKTKWNAMTDSQQAAFLGWAENYLLVNKIFFGFNFYKNLREQFFIVKSCKHYKGIRVFKGLPVNGQRTKTNSKTIKKWSIFLRQSKN